MPPRLPSAWTVAALAGILGAGVGSGTAAIATLARPMRIGDFSGSVFERVGQPGAGGPKAVIGSSEHDFGSMGSGQSGTHCFRIVNGGDTPLRLTKGQSSCGCTIAALEKEEIAPGDSGDITIEWRTKGEGGPFRQQVTVHTNDPRRPDISLRIAGTVVPTWRALPSTIVFPKLGTSQAETATVTLLTYGQPPPTLDRISAAEPATADFFALESRPLTSGELEMAGDQNATGGLAITVATRPGLPLGPLRQTVRAILLSGEASRAGGAAPVDREGGAGKGVAAGDGPTIAKGSRPEESSIEPAKMGEIVVEIPVEGTVTGDLAVAGRAWDSSSQVVSLGSVSSRTGLRTEVFLTVKGPHREAVRPRLKEVVPPSLVVDIGESKPVGAGTVRRVPIAVSIPPGSPTCNHLGNKQAPLGRIVLETGHPDTPLLEIPVRISIGP